MNFNNPTNIQLGAVGLFSGRKYRVAGRVLLGEMEDGIIYGWSEFNLVTDAGESATLVFEQTDRGPEWRWFTMFEPEFPFPEEDAATKKVGDHLNLDGTDVVVTLVQESRIYQIEGTAPEGQRVGSRANYFNAEAGSKMIVVSWTGKEMEYYQGRTISSNMVAAGFNLPAAQLLENNGGSISGAAALKIGAVLLVGLFFVVLIVSSGVEGSRAPAVVNHPAPPPPLSIGSAGTLNGTHYRVVGHAQVEIAEVGHFVDRHEYYLQDDDTNDALLVYGADPDAKDWILFTPHHPATALSPQQAGNVRIGQTISVDGVIAPVSELFRSTVQQVEDPDRPDLRAGEVRYGFSAQAGSTVLLVRWNEAEIEFEEGKYLDPKTVTGAFAQSTTK